MGDTCIIRCDEERDFGEGMAYVGLLLKASIRIDDVNWMGGVTEGVVPGDVWTDGGGGGGGGGRGRIWSKGRGRPLPLALDIFACTYKYPSYI